MHSRAHTHREAKSFTFSPSCPISSRAHACAHVSRAKPPLCPFRPEFAADGFPLTCMCEHHLELMLTIIHRHACEQVRRRWRPSQRCRPTLLRCPETCCRRCAGFRSRPGLSVPMAEPWTAQEPCLALPSCFFFLSVELPNLSSTNLPESACPWAGWRRRVTHGRRAAHLAFCLSIGISNQTCTS